MPLSDMQAIFLRLKMTPVTWSPQELLRFLKLVLRTVVRRLL
uniref:Uncharacterized protein n=1 Tax=Arundo donax TaxID=35708 RepID=A0A0A9FDU8_ARUDO